MSGVQWAAVLGLLGLALFAIPGAALGWAIGRWALRNAEDAARLPPVPDPDVRLVTTSPLAVGGKFPDTPPSLWSTVKAGQDRAALEIARQAAATEEEIRQMTGLAEEAIRARTRAYW